MCGVEGYLDRTFRSPMAEYVTTYLEMHSPEQLRPAQLPRDADPSFVVREVTERDWRFNRDLYFKVGENWNWTDKRSWSEEEWQKSVASPALRTFAAYYDEELAGYYELLRDDAGGVEIAYFGLLPDFIGRGLGGAMLTNAIEEAWRSSPSPARVWVHTCTDDHPGALANYEARGFVTYHRESADR